MSSPAPLLRPFQPIAPGPDDFALAAMTADEFARFFPQGLSAEGRNIRLVSPATSEELLAHCRSERPRVLLCSWSTPKIAPAAIRPMGGTVEYVCNVTGSVRHLVDRAMIAAGLLVTNWGPLIAPQVAEHALLLILGALRNIRGWRTIMEACDLNLRPGLGTRSLFRKNAGIHGFGSIARNLVSLLEPFAVQTEVYAPGVPLEDMRRFNVKVAPSLVALARDKDIFVCCEALTDVTRWSINREVLSALPEGAVFCNIGRGAIVDETALAEIAVARRLRVASDVFVAEPLAANSPLLQNELALLSPHIGGPTDDSYADCGAYARENLLRFQRGHQVTGIITVEIFDRST